MAALSLHSVQYFKAAAAAAPGRSRRSLFCEARSTKTKAQTAAYICIDCKCCFEGMRCHIGAATHLKHLNRHQEPPASKTARCYKWTTAPWACMRVWMAVPHQSEQRAKASMHAAIILTFLSYCRRLHLRWQGAI
jgi:hypothetical protein